MTLAIFFSHAFDVYWLLASGVAVVILFTLNRWRVYIAWPYAVTAIALGLFLHAAGVHATLAIFLERQGHALGTDRMYRLWRQEGLQVPKKRPRRRVAASRPRPLPPTGINHVWAHDFVFDTCADGRSLKCLTVIDEFTRECLAIDVAGGIRSGRVIEVLTQLVSLHGAPRYLRSDYGPEFVARAILRWLQAAQIETAYIDPGKPWQNGTDESFNGKLREHFSLQWFRNRADAKVSIEPWRRHYNEVRPHSSTASGAGCMSISPSRNGTRRGRIRQWLRRR